MSRKCVRHGHLQGTAAKRIPAPRLPVLLFVALSGCSLPENTGALVDVPLDWRVEAVWTRGGTDDPTLQLSLLQPYQLAAVQGGAVAVLDWREAVIHVIDSLGTDQGTIGRKGDGPGELQRPFGIATTSDGGLAAIDPIVQRYVQWGPEGRPRDEGRAPAGIEGPRFTVGDGWIQVVVAGRDSAGARIYSLVRDFGDRQETLATSARAEYAVGDLPSCGGGDISSYPLLAPRIVWAASNERTAVSATSGYEVRVLEGGREIGRITRPIAPEVTDSALAAFHARGRHLNRCPLPPMEVVRAFGFAVEAPIIAGMVFAPDGSLLVARRVRGMEPVIDVFDVDLRYVGTLPKGFPMPAAFVGRQGFVSTELDSLDVPVVRFFRVIGGPTASSGGPR